jgi:hypothetical protein
VPGLPGWESGVRLTTPPRKNVLLRNHGGRQDPYRVAEPVKKEEVELKTVVSDG